jgi:hypothetical protein
VHLKTFDSSVHDVEQASDMEVRVSDEQRVVGTSKVDRGMLPIRIDHRCMSHSMAGQQTQASLKLFKIACLAYNPSPVEYRGLTLERAKVIEVRRGLIERIERIIPQCELFSGPANFPKRYFDDLMMESHPQPVKVDRGPSIREFTDQLSQDTQSIHFISPHSRTNLQSVLP